MTEVNYEGTNNCPELLLASQLYPPLLPEKVWAVDPGSNVNRPIHNKCWYAKWQQEKSHNAHVILCQWEKGRNKAGKIWILLKAVSLLSLGQYYQQHP
jgi:hypothetical protein